MDLGLIKWIKQLQDGDEAAFDLLREQYAGLLLSSVSKAISGLPGAEFDDLMQEATLALYHAAMRFDLSQDDVTFGLYAKICIHNRLVSIGRRLNRQKYATHSVSQIVPSSSEKRIARRADFLGLENVAEEILSSFEFSVYQLYLEGCSVAEIAAQLEKPSKSIDNAIYRMRKKIKTYFEDSSTL